MSERVICICGPTAVGKSEVAEEVALALGTDVISVDSMQVYTGMDIGTAKTAPERRRVALQMVDVADIGSDYSVAEFQRAARALVDERLATGGFAVLCGGTGLYLDAVIDEMDFAPGATHGPARSSYERYASEHGARALWELLHERDARSAEDIHPNNVHRVARALELADEGRSYACLRARLRERPAHYEAKIWALFMERGRLYERIDARVDAMLAHGLLDEVRGLVDRGFGADATARQAIGYKELLEHLEGRITLGEATERIKRRTRRYAKRQLSWLRRDGRASWLDMGELSPGEAAATIVETARGRA